MIQYQYTLKFVNVLLRSASAAGVKQGLIRLALPQRYQDVVGDQAHASAEEMMLARAAGAPRGTIFVSHNTGGPTSASL